MLIMDMKLIFALLVPVIFTALRSSAQTGQDPFSGQYQMTTQEVVLTLDLKLQPGSKVTGTLSSSTRQSYSMDGIASGNSASGSCSDGAGSVYFELYVESDELILSLIEPDAWNNPDYSTATYLSFSRVQQDITSQKNTAMDIPGTQSATGGNDPGREAVGNAAWGFQFIPPEGWSSQQTSDGLILGHQTIPGMILVFPHMLTSLPEIRQEMMNGIQDGMNYLVPGGAISVVGDGILTGDYTGIMDSQQVKGRGFGTLSPYGGGAFILAVSTPDKLGEAIIRDAGWIAGNLVYRKMETSDLVMHFAGRWASFTTNTSTWIQFYPDGSYDEQYESSYSGELSGGGNWGAYGGENAKGKWTVQGNRDQGRITVRLFNGNEIYYDYRVHEQNGEKYYGEYWFNGKLYGKSRD